MLWATLSSSPGFLPCLPGTTASGCPPAPLAATPWSLQTDLSPCPLLRHEGLWFSRLLCSPRSAHPTWVFISGQLSVLSPDSMDVQLCSRHFHLDVRRPSAQPPSFPSNLSLLSQLLTPGCPLTNQWHAVRSRL